MDLLFIIGGGLGTLLFSYIIKTIWDILLGAWNGNNLMQFVGGIALVYFFGLLSVFLLLVSIGIFIMGFLDR